MPRLRFLALNGRSSCRSPVSGNLGKSRQGFDAEGSATIPGSFSFTDCPPQLESEGTEQLASRSIPLTGRAYFGVLAAFFTGCALLLIIIFPFGSKSNEGGARNQVHTPRLVWHNRRRLPALAPSPERSRANWFSWA
jgi:hypothetical protein